MICWFADFFIHEDLMVNFWVPFLSRDFWICLQIENEENDDIWRSSWVETTNFCSDAAKLWLLSPQLFRFRNHSFLKSKKHHELTNKTPARDDFFLTPSHRGYRVKIQTAGVLPHQVSFCWKIRFVNVTFQACSQQNFDTGFLKQMFSWHIDSLQRLSFVSFKVLLKSRSWDKPLGFCTPPTAEPLFGSAAFPPDLGSPSLDFTFRHVPKVRRVTFFSGETTRDPWPISSKLDVLARSCCCVFFWWGNFRVPFFTMLSHPPSQETRAEQKDALWTTQWSGNQVVYVKLWFLFGARWALGGS